jgi:hypothetical protein
LVTTVSIIRTTSWATDGSSTCRASLRWPLMKVGWITCPPLASAEYACAICSGVTDRP